MGLAFMALCLLAVHTAQAVYVPMSGDIIKLANRPALYYIDDYNARHLFPNSATFWTWYIGIWKDQKIKVVPQVDFDNLDVGKNVTARPGTGLVQFDNANKVYALTPGAVLCEVRALYGDNWQSYVIPIQDSFESDYFKNSACNIISTSKYPDGSIIQYAGAKDIWYISGGKKRQFTGNSFIANNFKDSYVIKNVPATISYSAGPSISGSEAGFTVGPTVNISSNPNNSSASSSVDLAVMDIITPTSKIYKGNVIDVQVVVKNLGANLTSGKGLDGAVLTATDWVTDNISHADFPSTVSPFKTGQLFTIDYRGRFLNIGDKTITVKMDTGGELVESNENNNTFSKKITVSN